MQVINTFLLFFHHISFISIIIFMSNFFNIIVVNNNIQRIYFGTKRKEKGFCLGL